MGLGYWHYNMKALPKIMDMGNMPHLPHYWILFLLRLHFKRLIGTNASERKNEKGILS